MIETTCSWCHARNPATRKRCQNCGHFAQVPRMECECAQCVTLAVYTAVRKAKGEDVEEEEE